MNLPRLRHSLAVILIALLAPLASAGDDSVQTMAGILIKLNHFPSAEEKTTLQAIIASPDSSAATKTIAQAIHDMQHSVSAADKAKLEAIASDPAASDGEKTLAGILAGISHQPGAEAKATLETL